MSQVIFKEEHLVVKDKWLTKMDAFAWIESCLKGKE